MIRKHPLFGLICGFIVVLHLSACSNSLVGLVNPFNTPTEPEPAADATQAEPALSPVFSLTSDEVLATGIVVPAQEVNLSFAVDGRLLEVYVKEGDYVRKGDLLAQLDDSEQLIALATAKVNLSAAEAELAATNAGPSAEEIVQVQADLTKAEAALTKLLSGPTPEQLGEAEARLSIAQAQLNDLLAGPRPEQVEGLEARLLRAEVDLAAAQAEYDKVAFFPDIGSHPASLHLQKMTITYDQIKAEYDAVVSGPTPTEIAVAKAQLKSAEATLARAKMPASAEDILHAQATVAQAEARLAQLEAGASQVEKDLLVISKQASEIKVEQAEFELKKTKLLASFDGVVASILPNAGELIAAGRPIVLLGDTSKWYATTNELTEFDLSRVQPGDTVKLNIEALPDAPFVGVVDNIAPVSEGVRNSFRDGADANYRLTVAIAEGQLAELRWGMTIDMAISTKPF